MSRHHPDVPPSVAAQRNATFDRWWAERHPEEPASPESIEHTSADAVASIARQMGIAPEKVRELKRATPTPTTKSTTDEKKIVSAFGVVPSRATSTTAPSSDAAKILNAFGQR